MSERPPELHAHRLPWFGRAQPNRDAIRVEVDFGANRTLTEIDVFTLQDNWAASTEPTEAMTFTLNGLSGYEVQYWTASNWLTVPGGSVTGNNKIWKKFEFSPITMSKIRVLTSASPDGVSRITEIEAYGPAATAGNGLHWLVSDHLGTPRLIFDQSGNLDKVKRHDYAPSAKSCSSLVAATLFLLTEAATVFASSSPQKNGTTRRATQTVAPVPRVQPWQMARPIDDSDKKGHRKKHKKDHDKHTKTKPGDRQPPNFRPFDLHPSQNQRPNRRSLSVNQNLK